MIRNSTPHKHPRITFLVDDRDPGYIGVLASIGVDLIVAVEEFRLKLATEELLLNGVACVRITKV